MTAQHTGPAARDHAPSGRETSRGRAPGLAGDLRFGPVRFGWIQTARRAIVALSALLLCLGAACEVVGLPGADLASALPVFSSPSPDVSLGESSFDEDEDACDEDDSLGDEAGDRDLLSPEIAAALSGLDRRTQATTGDEESPGRAVSQGLFRPPQA